MPLPKKEFAATLLKLKLDLEDGKYDDQIIEHLLQDKTSSPGGVEAVLENSSSETENSDGDKAIWENYASTTKPFVFDHTDANNLKIKKSWWDIEDISIRWLVERRAIDKIDLQKATFSLCKVTIQLKDKERILTFDEEQTYCRKFLVPLPHKPAEVTTEALFGENIGALAASALDHLSKLDEAIGVAEYKIGKTTVQLNERFERYQNLGYHVMFGLASFRDTNVPDHLKSHKVDAEMLTLLYEGGVDAAMTFPGKAKGDRGGGGRRSANPGARGLLYLAVKFQPTSFKL